MSLDMKFTFDPKTYRHYMDGHLSVLHCHHYMSLTTLLAEQMRDIGGTRILTETTEDSVRPLLDGYCQQRNITDPMQRLNVGREYYSVMGMGLIDPLSGVGPNGGTVRLSRSHVDQGWKMKWGAADHSVNYFTCGYLAAMFAAAFNRPARSFQAKETASLVTGSPYSEFVVTKGAN